MPIAKVSRVRQEINKLYELGIIESSTSEFCNHPLRIIEKSDGRAYQFCRIPFGIKTAISGFVRAVNSVLGNKLSDFLKNVCRTCHTSGYIFFKNRKGRVSFKIRQISMV